MAQDLEAGRRVSSDFFLGGLYGLFSCKPQSLSDNGFA